MADFLLTVGVDANLSYSEMQAGISAIVSRLNSNPQKIKVQFDIDKTSSDKLKAQLSAVYQSAMKPSENIGNQMNMSAMRMYVSNGRILARSVTQDAKAASAEISNMASKFALVNGALKEIQATNASITSAYKNIHTALGGGMATGQEAAELDAIKSKYIELMSAVETLRSAKSSATQDDISNIYKLQAETQGLIQASQSRIDAENEAARAAQQAAKDEANAAKQTAKEKEAAAKQAANAQKEQERADKQAAADAAKRTAAIKQYYDLQKRMQSALEGSTAAKNSRNPSSVEAYSNLKTAADTLKSYESAIHSGAMSTKEIQAATAAANATFSQSTATIRANGDATQTLSERLGNLAGKFSSWLTVSQVIMYAVRSIRQMISASIELDDAMTQMQIVTRASDTSMSEFANSAADASKRIGSSISDFVDSATTFARLGYDMDESSRLAEFTAMLQNVGDIDVRDAQDAITSIIKAFDIDVSQVESVMDKLVITGNNFPISVSQIAEGMTNASSTLAAAGNSFEQSVALLTAANTTMQDAAKASTGLRTIAARIRNTKTELDDLGEVMTSASYDKLVQILTDYNVALTDTAGEYRSTYDIMYDVAQQWEKMSSMEQSALATAMSGNRQQAVFFSLIEQFKEASGAMEAMENSAGALDKAYATFMESTTAHINKFKATFQALSADVFQSDFLSFFVDIGSGILSAVDAVFKLVNALGGLKAVLFTVGAAFAVIRAEAIFDKLDSVLTGIGSIGTAITTRLSAAVSAYTSQAASAAAGTSRFAAAMKALGVTVNSTQVVMMAIIAVIGAAVIAYNKFKQNQEEIARKSKEVADDYKQQQSSLAGTKSTLDGLMDRYAKLSRGVNALGENVSLTSSEYSEYQSIVSQIADMFPSLIEGYDSQGNAILKCRDDVNALTEAYREQIKAANDAVLTNADTIGKAFANDQKNWANNRRDQTAELWEQLLTAKDLDAAISNLLADVDESAEAYFDINNMLQSLYDVGLKPEKGESGADFIRRAVTEERDLIDSIISDYKSQLASSVSELHTVAQAYVSNALADSGTYSDIAPQMHAIINQIISGFDYDFYKGFMQNGKFNFNELYQYISENILEPFAQLSDSDVGSISLVLDLQTKYNNGECTVGEYMNAIVELRDAISGLDADTQKSIMLSIGFDGNDIRKQYQSVMSQFYNSDFIKMKPASQQEQYQSAFKEWIDGMSAEELEVAYKLSLDPKSVKWSLTDWRKQFSYELQRSSVIPEDQKISFSELIEDEDFTDSIDGYIDKVRGYRDALADLKSGDMTEDEIVIKFPEILTDSGDVEADLNAAIDATTTQMRDKLEGTAKTIQSDSLPMFNQYVDAVLRAGEASGDTGAALRALSDALSAVDDASSLLTKSRSGDLDYLDLLEAASDLANKSGKDMMTFLTDVNGELALNEQEVIDWAASVADAMAVYDIDQSIIDNVKERISANIEEASSFEQLTSAMSKAEKAASLIGKAEAELAENGKNSLDTLSSLMDLYGEDWSKYATFDENGEFKINTKGIRADIYQAIDDVKNASPQLKQAIKDSLDIEIETESFDTAVDDYVSKITSLQDALDAIQSGDFTADNQLSLINQFPQLRGRVNDLDVAVKELMADMDTDITSQFIERFANAKTGEERAEILGLMQTIQQLRAEAEESIVLDINVETEGMQNLLSAIEESTTAAGLSAESIENLRQRYEGLEGLNTDKLFANTATGIKLNTKELTKLESAYQKQKRLDIDNELKSLTSQYNDLSRQIDAAGDSASTMGLEAQRDKILSQIKALSELSAQYDGLTSHYQKWIDAQSTPNEGEMYENITNGLKGIKELYDKGLVGTDDFKTAAQLMTNKDLSLASINEYTAAYEEGYPKMQRYFTESADGCKNFLNDISEINSEWAHLNEDGNWELNFDTEAWADALGISVDAVEAILRRLSDYGFDINFDTAFADLDTIRSKAESAAETLSKLGKTDYTFDLSATGIDRVNEQLAEAQRIFDQFATYDSEGNLISFDVDAEGAREAQYLLGALILQQQELNKPAILKVDVSNVAGEVGEALRTMQELAEAYELREFQIRTGVDTTEVDQTIAELEQRFSSYSPETTAKVGVDLEGEETVQEQITSLTAEETKKIDPEIQDLEESDYDLSGTVTFDGDFSSVDAESPYEIDGTVNFEAEDLDTSSLDAEANVVYKVDSTSVDEYVAPDKDATAGYNVDDATVKSWVAPDKTAKVTYNLVAPTYNPPNLSRTLTYHIKTVGSAGAAGTAHARGTAYARGTTKGKAFLSGDWSTKRSGTALGGEVGQELVVRDGKFFTIGDNGAEFFRYKKGDIIFNAEQTEELLKHGKASSNFGRGMAYVDGTAFATGSGSGNFSGGASGGSSSSGSSSSSSKPSSSSSSKSSKKDDDSEIFDWIEVAIDRIERAIQKLERTATSAFKTLKTRLSATADEISKVTEEINIQQRGYARYLEEAASVNLSENIKKLVRDGAIDIREYDKETAQLIKDYQEWYEKALDCADAVEELNETLGELYQSRFDDIETDYDNQLELLNHLTETYKNGLDELEARGYLGGAQYYEALRAVEEQNISVMQKELTDLIQAMSDGVNSGTIQEGSEAWYEMQKSINDTKEAIQEANIAMIEYNNSMRELNWSYFDYLQDRISQVTSEADFLIDLMSSSELYTDKGQLTDTGMASMGMHGVNYNTYMAQADLYAEELKKINKDLANDPYNTILIERKEELLDLQRKSILAAEDEKQAIVSMVEEGIKRELSSLKDLIDTYTDSLDSAKDLYEYQKKIKKQTSEIASLQKQLAAYENDTSEENRARLQKIRVELADAQADLEETQYEKYIKDQKKLLNDLYDEYEDILNQRLDDVDALISDMIDKINKNASDISDTIASECKDVGYTLTEAMSSIWNGDGGVGDIISTYGDGFLAQLTSLNTVLSGIATTVNSMVNKGDSAASDVVDHTTSSTDTIAPPPSSTPQPSTPAPEPAPAPEPETKEDKKKIKIVNGQWWVRKGPGTSYGKIAIVHTGESYEYAGESKGSWNSFIYKGTKRWVSSKGSKIVGYSQGGFIADAQKAAYRNGDDIVTVNTLRKGEAVLTPAETDLFSRFVDTLPQAQALVDASKYISAPPAMQSQQGLGFGDVSFNIAIDHVEDYDDFVSKMQKDEKFEKFIQSMTVDRIVGGSKLAKNKFSWKK